MAKSSHVLGCDITYNYIGNKKYAIQVNLYRDCRGVAFKVGDFSYYRAFATKTRGSFTYYLRALKFVKIENISERCQYTAIPCSQTNTYNTGYGIERHVYADTIDVSDSITKSMIALNRCLFIPCIRDNTSSMYSRFFYSEISLCNLSSPKIAFNNSGYHHSINKLKLAINTGQYLSFGVNDPDLDSIKYQWTNSVGTYPNGSNSYEKRSNSSYTFQYPSFSLCTPVTTFKCIPNPTVYPPKGMYLDTVTGDVVFTPTVNGDAVTFVVEALQYRRDSIGKWVYLGKTRREFDYWTYTAQNNLPPLMTDKRGYRVCAGRTLNFDFTIKDSTWSGYQTAPDTLTTKFYGIPNGAQITLLPGSSTNEKKYNFYWNTQLKDTNRVTYKLRVEMNDNDCSQPAITYRTFHILVDSKCCDTFKFPRVNPSKNFTSKVGDSITIASDTIKGYKQVLLKWIGKSPGFDWANIFESSSFRGTLTNKLKIRKVDFNHHGTQLRLTGNTDICRDSGSIYTVKIADTCFFVHVDSLVHIDTIRHHVRDTTFYEVFDTFRIVTQYIDSVKIVYKDTLRFNVYDTIRTKINDTTLVRLIVTDTVSIYKNILVQDTLKFTINDTINSGILTDEFSIYPVPSNRTLFLKVGDYQKFKGFYVRIYNVVNDLIQEKYIMSEKTEFQLDKWGSKGNYTLHLFDVNHKRLAVKVIIYQ